MFSARFILAALTTFLTLASAAPTTKLEITAEYTACTGVNFTGTCVNISAVSDECTNLIGGLTILNKEISSATIPSGFICIFFESFGCVSSGTNGTDKVALEGKPGTPSTNYTNFSDIQGVATSQSFNDLTSSISCRCFNNTECAIPGFE